MNVSTVFPEGYTETERPPRHASASVKDDEEVHDRYNREYSNSSSFMYKRFSVVVKHRNGFYYNEISSRHVQHLWKTRCII